MPDRPNVLFVLTDQWRGDALGCMGTEQVQTPNLDDLAESGVVFENAYTPQPICSPARGSIQTGCYPEKHRVTANSERKMPLTRDRDTIAERLSRDAYYTGYIGKWHLGGKIAAPGYIAPEERRGYQYWEGFDGGHAHTKGHPQVGPGGAVHWIEGWQPEIQTDLATEFFDEAVEGDRPFFLCLSWGPPHMPYEAPERYRNRYNASELELPDNVPDDIESILASKPYDDDPRETLAHYYGMITSMDEYVGQLRAYLDELDLLEETLIVFTSDHGEHMGSHGQYGKGTPHDTAIQVPLIIAHSGEIDPGRQTHGFVNLVDLMPTILGYCGVAIPDDVQGRDYSRYLRTPEADREQETFDDDVYARTGWWFALRTDRYLFAVDDNLETRNLYDLKQDPGQVTNLANLDPADHDAPLNDLRERLVEAAFRYDDYEFKQLARFSYSARESIFDFGDWELRYDADDDQRLENLRR